VNSEEMKLVALCKFEEALNSIE